MEQGQTKQPKWEGRVLGDSPMGPNTAPGPSKAPHPLTTDTDPRGPTGQFSKSPFCLSQMELASSSTSWTPTKSCSSRCLPCWLGLLLWS